MIILAEVGGSGERPKVGNFASIFINLGHISFLHALGYGEKPSDSNFERIFTFIYCNRDLPSLQFSMIKSYQKAKLFRKEVAWNPTGRKKYRNQRLHN